MAEGSTVQLCEIGRHAQGGITPKKFCEKLGGSLSVFESLNLIQIQKCRNLKFRYLILDESDVQREYAEKLEGIEKVRDGSTGNLYGQGYGIISVIGITKDEEYIPLILQRYTTIQIGRKAVIRKAIEALGPDTGAVWLIDRGADDEKLFSFLLKEKQQFLIRLDRRGGERCLTVDGPEGMEKHKVSALTAHMVKSGYRKVKLPKRPEALTLLHYHGYLKQEPMALLTTLSPRTPKQAEAIAKAYRKRWKIENYLRFIKGRFRLEDVMIKLPDRVDGLPALVLIASAFVMKQMQRIKEASDIALTAFYAWWAGRERCDLSWSSVARFLRHVFRSREVTLRTVFKSDESLQLALLFV
ncbi:transposase [Candidatus Peregrinibacteria bacterium]|nr:transposase [Candidatus Peregrinibacteria bacterium]